MGSGIGGHVLVEPMSTSRSGHKVIATMLSFIDLVISGLVARCTKALALLKGFY